jgi:16S rRNA processing protein RimM
MSAVAPAMETHPGWPDDAVEVGRIVGAWGVKGWFKVQPFAAEPQALLSSRRWRILPPDDAVAARATAPTSDYPSLLKITGAKAHGDGVVAQAQEVTGRDAARALRGARVFVGRSSFPTAGADEYYWVDLVGLRVVNRQAETLGTVAGLIDTGPHSVLRVAPVGMPAGEAGQDVERLIPFVAAYVDEVSLERRCITVDWGLDY